MKESQFDDIRPYNAEEFPKAMQRIANRCSIRKTRGTGTSEQTEAHIIRRLFYTRPGMIKTGRGYCPRSGRKNVEEIGKSAFSGCTALAAVTIKSTDLKIDESAFYKCEKLESIVIPDGVTTIGDSAFSGSGAHPTLNASQLSEGANTITVNAMFDDGFNGDFNHGRTGIFRQYVLLQPHPFG